MLVLGVQSGFRPGFPLKVGNDERADNTRFLVEQSRMRYFNIPSTGKLPGRKQVDEFLDIARNRDNHPILVNCAFIERVAPFMMIFRIKEQGWTEKRAVEEAASSSLKKDTLEKFARDYLAPRTKPTG